MHVLRKCEVDTDDFKVGDQIQVGHYTATCQDVTQEGAIFLLDQYLDKAMTMNDENDSEGGYTASDLRNRLNSGEIMIDFNGLRDRMMPFKNGDLLRLPFYGEIFGHDEWYKTGRVEPDECEQWPLMRNRRNHIAERKGDDDACGWLQNKSVKYTTHFFGVDYDSYSNSWPSSYLRGVRPVFIIGRKIERVE